MNDGSAVLNIVETNPFKHLVHLSLNVVPGNDEAIKTFLSECLRDYKVCTQIDVIDSFLLLYVAWWLSEYTLVIIACVYIAFQMKLKR